VKLRLTDSVGTSAPLDTDSGLVASSFLAFWRRLVLLLIFFDAMVFAPSFGLPPWAVTSL